MMIDVGEGVGTMQKIDIIAFVGEDVYCKQTPEMLLAQMDRCGVAKTFIAPAEKYVTVYNREGNDLIAEACKRWPDRFCGYAVANPWYGEAAVAELKRALDNGLKAVYFDSSIQGFTISDEIVYPLIEVCREYKVPVYFHTGTPAFALPFQLHFLAEKFPDVQFIMGHSGANDFAGDAVPALRGCPNIWLETSTNLTVSYRAFTEAVPDRVLFGSAAPRSKLGYEIQRAEKGVMGQEKLEALFSGNAKKLFDWL